MMNQIAMLQHLENEVAKLEQIEKEESRHGCIIFIDSSIENPRSYTSNLLDNYLDEIPEYEVEKLENIMEEYEEDKEYYDDIHEYCKKIYGGYIKSDKIMSTLNYDSLMSSYNIKGDYFVRELIDTDLPTKIDLIVTSKKEIFERQNIEDTDFDIKLKELYNLDLDGFVVYVEYYVS